ncbi:helix-turn-helix transcriptional regulator [Bifidobacterium cebidarum]|uniref:XRE family transcriptional regulator n=1 Tax=Bifidobacterium cebidarum TaxID=2650773 RepID=A0A6I1GB15_9BIFI|nr:helix-turn-helix domain-containing protein [Bifidobacterium cebidarum]KAB7787388.1 XRE family transcriptional regulator [Bifidobacterium cebidarum]
MRISSSIRSMRQISTSLRDARIVKGLTQAELAELTGLTRPWINQFEQGKIMNASFSRILLMCRVLEVTFTVSYDVPKAEEDSAGNESSANQEVAPSLAHSLALSTDALDALQKVVQSNMPGLQPQILASASKYLSSLNDFSLSSESKVLPDDALNTDSKESEEATHD